MDFQLPYLPEKIKPTFKKVKPAFKNVGFTFLAVGGGAKM